MKALPRTRINHTMNCLCSQQRTGCTLSSGSLRLWILCAHLQHPNAKPSRLLQCIHQPPLKWYCVETYIKACTASFYTVLNRAMIREGAVSASTGTIKDELLCQDSRTGTIKDEDIGWRYDGLSHLFPINLFSEDIIYHRLSTYSSATLIANIFILWRYC